MKLHGYLILVDGVIEQREFTEQELNLINPSKLDPSYNKNEKCHIVEEDDYVFFMHPDNSQHPIQSDLPLNLGLQRYFPNSPFVGNIIAIFDSLVVRIINDELKGPSWTLENFSKDYALKELSTGWRFYFKDS